MAFRSPILAGPTLVRAAIQSANFLAGSAGWQIQRNGNAEFNGATFRGTVVIQGNQAILFYSGVPAAGNLVASFSPVAGADTFGNAYPAGMKVGGIGQPGVVAGYSGTTGLIFFPNIVPNVVNDAKIQMNSLGVGTAMRGFLTIGSPEDATQLDGAFVNLFASSQDGTQTAHLALSYQDPGGGVHSYVLLDPTGAACVGSLTAVDPTTGSGRANPAAAETWHTPAVNALFTTVGTTVPLRYRKEGLGPNGVVRLDGEVITTGAGPWPAGTVIATMGNAGYHPASIHRFITPSGVLAGAGSSTVQINGAGQIITGVTYTAAAQVLYFDGVTFPLD